VQRVFKICALILPVGPAFKNLPIDGDKLPLNPGPVVKWFELKIEDFFVINSSDGEIVFLSMLW
jgi:hypothetical protein